MIPNKGDIRTRRFNRDGSWGWRRSFYKMYLHLMPTHTRSKNWWNWRRSHSYSQRFKYSILGNWEKDRQEKSEDEDLGIAIYVHCGLWNYWPTGTCCIARGALPNILCSSMCKKNLKKNVCVYIYICTDTSVSLGCAAEIITTLYHLVV